MDDPGAGFDLVPHPEGGRYREIHRSNLVVGPADGRGERAALTVILFHLAPGEWSRWHRVRSDEAWHHHAGGPLELFVAGAGLDRFQRVLLGPPGEGAPVHVVPAGSWQAARPSGAAVLAACDVGPGFDFADFTMLRDDAEASARLRAARPHWAAML